MIDQSYFTVLCDEKYSNCIQNRGTKFDASFLLQADDYANEIK